MTFFKTLLATMLGFFVCLFIVGIIFVGTVAAMIASLGSTTEPVVKKGTVLVVDLSSDVPEFSTGVTISELAGGHGAMQLRDLLAGLERAKTDSRIAGIWLKPSGFSGSWSKAEEIRTKLLEVKRAKKFIYASSDPHGYSERELFLATSADSILIDPSGGMEMNGIAASLMFFKPALDRLGIEPEIVRAGTFKSAVEPFLRDSASPESRAMTQWIVDSTFNHVRSIIQSSRKMTSSQLQSILDTRALMTAEESVQLGLADAALYDDQIIELLKRRTAVKPDGKLATVDLDDYIDGDNDDADKGDSQIAVVYAVGTIVSGSGGYNPNPLFGGESIGTESFAEAMKTARESKSVKAIVLRIDSPGGDAAASEAMWREIRLAAAVKPVIASMAGVAASGGYFLAAAADTIVAESTTITGSIGVFRLGFNMKRFLDEKLGVNIQSVTSGPLADMGSIGRRMTDLERTILQRNVDSTYKLFMGIVAQGRGMTIQRVGQLAEGRVYTGDQAKALGLVDEIGGLDRSLEIAAARAGLKSDGYDLRILPRKRSPLDAIAEMFEGSISRFLAADSQVEQYKVLIEALQRRSGVQMRMDDLVID